MIRDPSDGTVREKSDVGIPRSGLPISKEKAEELTRLEKSREWLKAYSLKSGFSPSTM